MTDFFRRPFSDDFMATGHRCDGRPDLAGPPVSGGRLPREAAIA